MSLFRKRLATLGTAALLGCGSPGPARTDLVANCGIGQRSGTTWGTYWTMVLGRRR